jgi:hypothetical protein
MSRSNVGLATILIILTILPSSMSIPFQWDSQPLMQDAKAQNVRNMETNINPLDLEFDAKFFFDQKNRCGIGTDCLNEGTIALTLAALDQGKINSDSIQKVAQQNKCRGADTPCKNSGPPEFLKSVEISITALGHSDVEADAYQLVTGENRCSGAANCNNGIGAVYSAFSDDSSLDGEAKQQIYAENRCNDSAICTNSGSALFNPVAMFNPVTYDQAELVADAMQDIYIENSCGGAGTNCSNDGDEIFSVTASGDSSVESYGKQELFVDNDCNWDDTTCGGK